MDYKLYFIIFFAEQLPLEGLHHCLKTFNERNNISFSEHQRTDIYDDSTNETIADGYERGNIFK